MPPISRTSIYVAAGRAVGAREPDPLARNPDYLAERLLGDPATLDVDHPAVRALGLPYAEAMEEVEVISAVRMMTVRTRFIDDALTRAVAEGATQVAIDFQHEDLPTVLTRHGYEPAQRTLFILEGVTMYLSEAAVRGTLRFVAAHPPGSGIVFDFVYSALIDMLARIDMAAIPAAQKPYVERFLELIKDEPWTFGLPMGTEREFLGEFGLELREILTVGGAESLERYLTRTDGTQVGAEVIAAAMARMRASGQAASEGGQPPSPERMRAQQRLMSYQLAEAVVAGPASPRSASGATEAWR